MTKRMLIDGTHREETRVVITDGNRLEEYDIETSTKTQLKGNIYLAKVTRVEPSLQAAFVDYGGGRHGFLAFSEIHPDYYQIPIEDREALKRDLAELEVTAQAAHAHVEAIDGHLQDGDELGRHGADDVEEEPAGGAPAAEAETDPAAAEADHVVPEGEPENGPPGAGAEAETAQEAEEFAGEPAAPATAEEPQADNGETAETDAPRGRRNKAKAKANASARRISGRRGNPMRRYKIQEVIKRRQILLVQVVKEERGNKGAALTTYLSLAGRYCVLMPNATRSGGGVSRKITNAADRRRLRDLLKDLDVPEGMGVIMRTAGIERSKSEIKRDFDYLMRLWEDVRSLTLESEAPALVYEEGDLIKRAIRDLYTRDIEEVHVEGTEAYQAAKKLMRMMMPSHAKRVQPYRDSIPLFHRYQVESQLESMHHPVVQLKSGGYIVIDTTEALVAIDVNSGRSTKERNIEETALKTNLEAATEIARQLRLRDLAGLIVIDFIDMDESRNQRAVEKRFKEAVKIDRARIQLGRISTFGLFELSRQRLRPSIIETSTESCPHCHGSGFIRSTESTALHALRMIEEEGIRMRSSEITVSVPISVALYILNQKRSSLIDIENRYGLKVTVAGDDELIPPDMRIERLKGKAVERGREEVPVETATDADSSEAEESEQKPKEARKRRSRRRRKKDGVTPDLRRDEASHEDEAAWEEEETAAAAAEPAEEAEPETEQEQPPRRPRRRGRRGGRRRAQRADSQPGEESMPAAAAAGNGSGMDTVEAAEESFPHAFGHDNGAGAETEAESLPNVPASGNGVAEEAAEEEIEEAADISAEPLANLSEPPPEPAAPPHDERAGATADSGPSESRPPRRGWWQRVLE